jgi:hypothetical protein
MRFPLSPISKLMRDGYLTSTASVILLAAVAWKGASRDPLLLACLIVGALASVVGMGLRWRAHLLEVAAKAESEAEKSPMSSNRLFRQRPR